MVVGHVDVRQVWHHADGGLFQGRPDRLAAVCRRAVRAVRHLTAHGGATRVAGADPQGDGVGRQASVRRRDGDPRGHAAGRRVQRPSLRVRAAHLPRRVGDRIPVAPRRLRQRLVGLDARSTARVHEPRLRRLPVPRPRARHQRPGERRSRLRLHDPAAVVPHVVGVRGYVPRAARPCSSRSTRVHARGGSARGAQRAQIAEARLRAEAAEVAGERRRARARRTSSCSARSAARSPRRSTSTRSSASSTNTSTSSPMPMSSASASITPEQNEIEYRLAIENGKRYAPYTRDTTDRDQLPVWCIEHGEPVFINDLPTEYSRYIAQVRGDRARPSRTARCPGSRSRSSTCRSSRRTACSASSPSRASRRTPTPSIT